MAGPLRFLPRRRGAAVPTLSRDEGLREAYTAHGAELYRFALRSLDDPVAAEDVVQARDPTKVSCRPGSDRSPLQFQATTLTVRPTTLVAAVDNAVAGAPGLQR
jgi:hypothetical protein